jgi:hypothetical protein
MHHLRDFRSPAIFEFFNTIGAKRSFANYRRRLSADIVAKAFLGGRTKKVLEPLMRLLRAATWGTISFHPKSIADLRSGQRATRPQRSPKIGFREIFFGLFDF